jgi:exopolysaccharide production protein ExoQ
MLTPQTTEALPGQSAATVRRRDSRAFYARLEALIVLLVLAFPLFGTFMPIERYMRPNVADLANAQAPTEKFDLSHLVEVCAEIVAAYLTVAYARGMLRGMRQAALPLAFVALIFLSCLWAPEAGTSFRRACHFLLYTIFALFIFQKYEIKDFARYMTRVLAVPVFASFAVLLLSPKLAFSSYQGDPYAIRGAAVDKNALGDIMGFAVVIGGYALFSGVSSRLLAGSVLLGSTALVALAPNTTSRLVVLAMTALAIYAWVVRRRAHPGWAIAGALLTVITACLTAFVVLDADDFLKLVGKSATLTGRTDVWRVVIEFIHLRPVLGYGYYFWGEVSTSRTNMWYEMGWPAPHAHNNWLDTALQLGMVGLCISAAFWLVSLFRSIRFGFFSVRPGAICMALICVNIFIRSWTESVTLAPAEMFWFWFVISYLYLARMSAESRRERLRADPRLSARSAAPSAP